MIGSRAIEVKNWIREQGVGGGDLTPSERLSLISVGVLISTLEDIQISIEASAGQLIAELQAARLKMGKP